MDEINIYKAIFLLSRAPYICIMIINQLAGEVQAQYSINFLNKQL
jgi:hypothetical protein